MDDELRSMVEAILFAAGRKLELAEIAKLCRRSEQDVLGVLTEWKSLLDSSTSPTMLLQDGTGWKLTIREKYVGVIRKVVTITELPKGHMETLAVAAYKAPVLQSKVIKIRTNKAYDHLSQLEDSGFITREKSGRTKLIKLTPKFFEYFDIDPSKLKQKFASSGDVEKAIEAKEREIEQFEVAQRKETGERLGTAQIVLQPDVGPPKKLEEYPAVQPVDELLPTGVQVFLEKMGELDVFDVPVESLPPEERPVEHSPDVHHKKKPVKKHPHEIHHQRKEKIEAEMPAEEAPAALEVETVEVPELVEEPKVEVPSEVPTEAPAPVKAPKAPKKEKPVVEETPVEQPAEVAVEEPKILTPAEKISKEGAEKAVTLKGRKFEEGKGLFPKGVPPEMEAKIEERIKRILTGEEKKE